MLNYNLSHLGINMKNIIKSTILVILSLSFFTACSLNHGQGVRPTASVLIGK